MFTQLALAATERAVEWEEVIRDQMLVHPKLLADAQRPFDNSQLREWQLLVQISNAEAAASLAAVGQIQYLGNSYGSVQKMPNAVAIVCKASIRDPTSGCRLMKSSSREQRDTQKAPTINRI